MRERVRGRRMPDYLRHKLGLYGCMRSACRRVPGGYLLPMVQDINPNGVNFNNYFGRIYQSRYLSGIAAGLKTESNKIGYVGAWGKGQAEVTGGCNALPWVFTL